MLRVDISGNRVLRWHECRMLFGLGLGHGNLSDGSCAEEFHAQPPFYRSPPRALAGPRVRLDYGQLMTTKPSMTRPISAESVETGVKFVTPSETTPEAVAVRPDPFQRFRTWQPPP